MKKYCFVNYKNKNILLLDFSNLSVRDIFKLLDESKSFICKQPKNSVLSLINITNIKYDANIINAFKKYVADNQNYILASAIYGASFFQGIAIETFVKSTSISIKICKDELEGKNWLVNVA